MQPGANSYLSSACIVQLSHAAQHSTAQLQQIFCGLVHREQKTSKAGSPLKWRRTSDNMTSAAPAAVPPTGVHTEPNDVGPMKAAVPSIITRPHGLADDDYSYAQVYAQQASKLSCSGCCALTDIVFHSCDCDVPWVQCLFWQKQLPGCASCSMVMTCRSHAKRTFVGFSSQQCNITLLALYAKCAKNNQVQCSELLLCC